MKWWTSGRASWASSPGRSDEMPKKAKKGYWNRFNHEIEGVVDRVADSLVELTYS